MEQVLLVRYGEIHLKGLNRPFFERKLIDGINNALRGFGARVRREQGRIYVHGIAPERMEAASDALTRVFGVHSISPAMAVEKDWDAIVEAAACLTEQAAGGKNVTFKVFSRRSDKGFPMNSETINHELGHVLLERFPNLTVDVHAPELKVCVEIREQAFIYAAEIMGAGGMPSGTAGRAALLISGGIDSPVAGYMIAKRGVKIDAVYFHAPPYTSERAKQKVVDLAKQVAKYSGPIRLHVVNFTDIQLYIYDQCPHDELTIIMRRYMMRIAEHFAKESRCLGLITGESIGQVASQTLQSLAATNEVCTLPVYRPVIGFDKQEIVERSWEIGTYETSIQPFEDCCTIFVAKHPVTKPNLNVIHRSETKLEEKIDELMKTALETVEIIEID